MNIFKNIFSVLLFLFLTNLYSQETDNPNRWVSTLSMTCEDEGYNLTILRQFSRPAGSSSYKIQLTYQTVRSEYCTQARKDILQRTYGGSPVYNATIVTRTARIGDYCNKDRLWIIGDVYLVYYLSPNPRRGGMYTTNVLHDPYIELSLSNISYFVTLYNQNRGVNPSLESCSLFICGKPKSPKRKGSKYEKTDWKLIKAHRKYIKDYDSLHPKFIRKKRIIHKSKKVKNTPLEIKS